VVADDRNRVSCAHFKNALAGLDREVGIVVKEHLGLRYMQRKYLMVRQIAPEQNLFVAIFRHKHHVPD
jgi:hypothetical protein